MNRFVEWFVERMSDINYKLISQMDNDECSWMKFADANDRFHVFYAKKPITPEIIRTTFAMENEPILFVVDDKLISDVVLQNEKPLWIRALHAVYYGRVSVWCNGGEFNLSYIRALHFEWGVGQYKYSEAIDMSGILFTRVDSQLRDFPGLFYIARFYDKAFWKEQPKQQKQKGESWKERAKKQREEWEQATKGHAQGGYTWEYQNHSNPNYSNKDSDYEDIYEAFKRAFNDHMRNHGVDYDVPYVRRTPTGDKWLQGFISTGNLHTAKAMYKALAKEWHPDLNPDKPNATETMKLINAAWDKAQEYLR